MPDFPPLPIVTPDPPRKTQAQKYGAALYLGLAGLAFLLLLIGAFGWGVWSLREVWADVYTLNDPRRPEPDRVAAAWRLARDPQVTPRQRWDLALSRTPPEVARYLLAESLPGAAAKDDPRGFALAAARSDGWPAWLRVLSARSLALAAGEGAPQDREALAELARGADPFVQLLARYALVVSDAGEVPVAADGADPEFARLLDLARRSPQPARDAAIQEATLRLRAAHPDAARVWAGWEEAAAGVVPKLRPDGR